MSTALSISGFCGLLDQLAAMDPIELQASMDSITLTPNQIENLHKLRDHFCAIDLSPEPTPSISTSSTSTSDNPWKALHRCNNLLLPNIYLPILSSTPEHFITTYNTATVHDACISATKSSQQQISQRLRELFIALALYDFVRNHFPRFSGNGLSDRMKDEVKALLPSVDVVEQYRMGKNLDHLCRCFGVGCVFYLAEYLSRDL
jgi:hypothetical protein